MRPLDGHSPTGEGCTIVWLHPDYSATSCYVLLSIEEIDDRWMQFDEYIALVGHLCAVPSHCLSDYMDWFYMISHPFMIPAQPGDPPRVLSIQQYEEFVEPDGYQQLMVVATPNETDIDDWCASCSTCNGNIFFWYLCLLLSLVFYY